MHQYQSYSPAVHSRMADACSPSAAAATATALLDAMLLLSLSVSSLRARLTPTDAVTWGCKCKGYKATAGRSVASFAKKGSARVTVAGSFLPTVPPAKKASEFGRGSA